MTRASWLIVILAPLLALIEAWAEEPGLVKNPGFEEAGADGAPIGWSGPRDVFSRDAEVKHGGKGSLKFTNSNADRYVLSTQNVPFKIGQRYQISMWVKTENIEGSDSGATFCVEWSDQEGKYLGGHYATGIKGTSDWTQLKAVTSRLPEKAGSFRLSCYVRKGMTGTAWWDDIHVERYREPAVSSVLVSPNYRNAVPDSAAGIRVRAFVHLEDYELTPQEVALLWKVNPSQGGPAVAQGVEGVPGSGVKDLVIPTADWAHGPYTIEIAAKPKDADTALGTASVAITRCAAVPERTAYVDEYNRFILNGKPFFPLGMYWAGVKPEELEVYADSAFNCLMPYGAPNQDQMDLIDKLGLKVIYSVKDIYSGTKWAPKGIESPEDEYAHIKAKTEAYAQHPALMAWYINDELPIDMVDRLSEHRQWLEDLDPNHPTWVVIYQVGQVRDYIPTFDVIGTDPYPIPKAPAARAGDWTRQTVDAVCGHRGVWQVPQVFNWANYKKDEKDQYRPPTFEEMRSMAWQCIAEGANGLVFYSWFDIRRDESTPFEEQWPKVKAMAQEISAMAPALLSIEDAPEVRVDQEDWLHSLVRQHDGLTYLILVNNGTEEQTAFVTLPAKPPRVADREGGEPLEVSRLGEMEVPLPPLGVRILAIEGLDSADE